MGLGVAAAAAIENLPKQNPEFRSNDEYGSFNISSSGSG